MAPKNTTGLTISQVTAATFEQASAGVPIALSRDIRGGLATYTDSERDALSGLLLDENMLIYNSDSDEYQRLVGGSRDANGEWINGTWQRLITNTGGGGNANTDSDIASANFIADSDIVLFRLSTNGGRNIDTEGPILAYTTAGFVRAFDSDGLSDRLRDGYYLHATGEWRPVTDFLQYLRIGRTNNTIDFRYSRVDGVAQVARLTWRFNTPRSRELVTGTPGLLTRLSNYVIHRPLGTLQPTDISIVAPVIGLNANIPSNDFIIRYVANALQADIEATNIVIDSEVNFDTDSEGNPIDTEMSIQWEWTVDGAVANPVTITNQGLSFGETNFAVDEAAGGATPQRGQVFVNDSIITAGVDDSSTGLGSLELAPFQLATTFASGLVDNPPVAQRNNYNVLAGDGTWVTVDSLRGANGDIINYTTDRAGLLPGPTASQSNVNYYPTGDGTWKDVAITLRRLELRTDNENNVDLVIQNPRTRPIEQITLYRPSAYSDEDTVVFYIGGSIHIPRYNGPGDSDSDFVYQFPNAPMIATATENTFQVADRIVGQPLANMIAADTEYFTDVQYNAPFLTFRRVGQPGTRFPDSFGVVLDSEHLMRFTDRNGNPETNNTAPDNGRNPVEMLEGSGVLVNGTLEDSEVLDSDAIRAFAANLAGLVPAPTDSEANLTGAARRYLDASGQWTAPIGGGGDTDAALSYSLFATDTDNLVTLRGSDGSRSSVDIGFSIRVVDMSGPGYTGKRVEHRRGDSYDSDNLLEGSWDVYALDNQGIVIDANQLGTNIVTIAVDTDFVTMRARASHVAGNGISYSQSNGAISVRTDDTLEFDNTGQLRVVGSAVSSDSDIAAVTNTISSGQLTTTLRTVGNRDISSTPVTLPASGSDSDTTYAISITDTDNLIRLRGSDGSETTADIGFSIRVVDNSGPGYTGKTVEHRRGDSYNVNNLLEGSWTVVALDGEGIQITPNVAGITNAVGISVDTDEIAMRVSDNLIPDTESVFLGYDVQFRDSSGTLSEDSWDIRDTEIFTGNGFLYTTWSQWNNQYLHYNLNGTDSRILQNAVYLRLTSTQGSAVFPVAYQANSTEAQAVFQLQTGIDVTGVPPTLSNDLRIAEVKLRDGYIIRDNYTQFGNTYIGRDSIINNAVYDTDYLATLQDATYKAGTGLDLSSTQVFSLDTENFLPRAPIDSEGSVNYYVLQEGYHTTIVTQPPIAFYDTDGSDLFDRSGISVGNGLSPLQLTFRSGQWITTDSEATTRFPVGSRVVLQTDRGEITFIVDRVQPGSLITNPTENLSRIVMDVSSVTGNISSQFGQNIALIDVGGLTVYTTTVIDAIRWNNIKNAVNVGYGLRLDTDSDIIRFVVDTDVITDTQYSAGTGLTLTGTQFSVDESVIATRAYVDSRPGGGGGVLSGGALSSQDNQIRLATDSDTDIVYVFNPGNIQEVQAFNYTGTRSNVVSFAGQNELLEIALDSDFNSGSGDFNIPSGGSVYTNNGIHRISVNGVNDTESFNVRYSSTNDNYNLYIMTGIITPVVGNGFIISKDTEYIVFEVNSISTFTTTNGSILNEIQGDVYQTNISQEFSVPIPINDTGWRIAAYSNYTTALADIPIFDRSSWSFDPDIANLVYDTDIATTIFDTDQNANQALTTMGTAIAALDSNITWNNVVDTDTDNQNRRYITIDLGTQTNITSSLTIQGGLNSTPILTATDGDPAHVATTYTLTSDTGAAVTSFTGSVADTDSEDISTIVSTVNNAINNMTQTPVNWTSVINSADSDIVLTAAISGDRNPWSITVNNGSIHGGAGNISFTNREITRGAFSQRGVLEAGTGIVASPTGLISIDTDRFVDTDELSRLGLRETRSRDYVHLNVEGHLRVLQQGHPGAGAIGQITFDTEDLLIGQENYVFNLADTEFTVSILNPATALAAVNLIYNAMFANFGNLGRRLFSSLDVQGLTITYQESSLIHNNNPTPINVSASRLGWPLVENRFLSRGVTFEQYRETTEIYRGTDISVFDTDAGVVPGVPVGQTTGNTLLGSDSTWKLVQPRNGITYNTTSTGIEIGMSDTEGIPLHLQDQITENKRYEDTHLGNLPLLGNDQHINRNHFSSIYLDTDDVRMNIRPEDSDIWRGVVNRFNGIPSFSFWGVDGWFFDTESNSFRYFSFAVNNAYDEFHDTDLDFMSFDDTNNQVRATTLLTPLNTNPDVVLSIGDDRASSVRVDISSGYTIPAGYIIIESAASATQYYNYDSEYRNPLTFGDTSYHYRSAIRTNDILRASGVSDSDATGWESIPDSQVINEGLSRGGIKTFSSIPAFATLDLNPGGGRHINWDNQSIVSVEGVDNFSFGQVELIITINTTSANQQPSGGSIQGWNRIYRQSYSEDI